MLRKSPYSLPASQYGGGRKRIFIGLMLASCCVACLALAFFLILPWSDYGQTLTWLPLLCMLVGGAGILALIWMCGTLVWHVYTGRYLPGVSSVRHVTIRLFFPLMELLAIQGVRTVYGIVTVPNEKSEGLHRGLGFQDAGICHNTGYVAEGWRDVQTFEKFIGSFDLEPVPITPFPQLDPAVVNRVLDKWNG